MGRCRASSHASPTIPSTASTSCCPGTSPRQHRSVELPDVDARVDNRTGIRRRTRRHRGSHDRRARRRIEPAALQAQGAHRRHARRPTANDWACANLHLAQAVRFVDFRTGQLRQGKLIAKHPTQITVFEEAVARRPSVVSWIGPRMRLQLRRAIERGTPSLMTSGARLHERGVQVRREGRKERSSSRMTRLLIAALSGILKYIWGTLSRVCNA